MNLNPVVYVDLGDAPIRSCGSNGIPMPPIVDCVRSLPRMKASIDVLVHTWRLVELHPDEAAAVPSARLARRVRERP